MDQSPYLVIEIERDGGGTDQDAVARVNALAEEGWQVVGSTAHNLILQSPEFTKQLKAVS